MLPPASASLRPRKIVGPIALLGMLFVTLIAGILIFQGNHIRRAQATDSSNLFTLGRYFIHDSSQWHDRDCVSKNEERGAF